MHAHCGEEEQEDKQEQTDNSVFSRKLFTPLSTGLSRAVFLDSKILLVIPPKGCIRSQEQSTAELHLGDSLECLGRLGDETCDIVFSSPPYNLGKEYEDEKDLYAYLSEQTKVVRELYRVLRPHGPFYRIFVEVGLTFRGRFIWHYGFGYHLDKRFSGRHDTVIWFTKTDNFIFNPPTTLSDLSQETRRTLEEEWKSGVMEIPNVRGSTRGKDHPSMSIPNRVGREICSSSISSWCDFA